MLIYALLAVVIGLAVAQVVRATRFSADIAALERQLARAQNAERVDLSKIPAIVVAFAERNGGTVGGPTIVVAQQVAEMRLDPGQPFFDMRARQVFGTRAPGFVWHAHGTMKGIIPVEIVDASVDDRGLLEARIAGSIPVAKASGPATDLGEAMRFLAELPFNPDAILNAPALKWTTVEPHSVTVSINTTGGEAVVRLDFDSNGDIVGIEATDRPRMVGDTVIPTRWVGRFADYTRIGAYRLPRTGEIAWILPAGEFVYWRGGMTSLVSG